MKVVLHIIRFWVGLLFIVSGLLKANDPLGLSYKMQEFFEVFQLHFMNGLALPFSLAMNVAEVVAGVALILYWNPKWVLRFLLVLILFFTFLTGYAVFSGKIKTCGCFGDCVPLTAMQSFIKDLLLLFAVLLLIFSHFKGWLKASNYIAINWLIASAIITSLFQWYVLHYLPVLDCLPYKTGNHIPTLMQPSKDAVPDSVIIEFTYLKNGKEVSFSATDFPDDFDSSYIFLGRKDKIVREGKGGPVIKDFYLTSVLDTDTTSAVLALQEPIWLLVVKENLEESWWKTQFPSILKDFEVNGQNYFVVSSNWESLQNYVRANHLLKADATLIKTMSRTNAVWYKLQAGKIMAKKPISSQVLAPL